MQAQVQDRILQLTQASAVADVELIQPLWNHYGTLSRVRLRGGAHASVIVKHIKIPKRSAHPRGFASAISRQRKIESYQIEAHWYERYNHRLPDDTSTPACLGALVEGDELFLLLEDLVELGFDQVLSEVSWREITLVLQWLARFHAQFMSTAPEGLWSCGAYWHLDTRPEELSKIEGTRVHRFASLIDARLKRSAFQTLIHGDAKLANFCFSSSHASVAAVDFQYVGRGCGVRDVAYFVGSCLSEAQCQALEAEILEIYFIQLRDRLSFDIDADALEAEWRALYPVAWADFQRFMLGWSPLHRKLTTYSDLLTERVIDELRDELLSAARSACLAAGTLIQAHQGRVLRTSSKGFMSPAGDIVTEVDVQAQKLILDHLAPTISRYHLGVLAEEGAQDDSRLDRHAFWTIDPLDGTQYFVEGCEGYAISIALVSQRGESLLGVVYDPVNHNLYQAVRGEGVSLNGAPLPKLPSVVDHTKPIQWFADRSLRTHPLFDHYQEHFEVNFVGGAVMNTLRLLTEARSCYVKTPKEELGGGAIWDFAAVTLMLTEAHGSALCYDGSALSMNRPECVLFNDVGLACTSSDLEYSEVSAKLEMLERSQR